MSLFKEQKTLPEELDFLIKEFLEQFQANRKCYNFIYTRLKESQRINKKQCKCVAQVVTEEYKRIPGGKGIGNISNAGAKKGSSPRFSIKRFKIHNIKTPLPKETKLEYFDTCTKCKKRYYVAAGTVFRKKHIGIKVVLLLFLIAEYYQFNSNDKHQIMYAFKYLANNNTDVNIKDLKTLYSYRDNFTSDENLPQLRDYKLIAYLFT